MNTCSNQAAVLTRGVVSPPKLKKGTLLFRHWGTVASLLCLELGFGSHT